MRPVQNLKGPRVTSFYDLPDGRLGDALDAAVSQAVCTPPAGERLFAYPGLLEVDWEQAACCHHSNIPLVGTIGAMIDPVAAAGALEGVRLPAVIGGVSRIDWDQGALLAAAAGSPGAERMPKQFFDSAVRAVIEAEELSPFFEFSGTGRGHYAIRPFGYADSEAADRAAFAAGETPEPRNLFDEMRRRANDFGLDTLRRVALVAIMALYNEQDTAEHFKGRGWVLTARELGEYLRDRADRRPAAFDNLLLAMAAYHGW